MTENQDNQTNIKMIHLPAGFGCDEFWMSETVITNAQWNAEMKEKKGAPDDYPVVDVSFEDALRFCAKLSERSDVKFTIPTDNQWCRAVGIEPESLEEYAVFDGHAMRPVKTRLPNEFGLHDMRGLVWEWIARKQYKKGQAQYLRGGAWPFVRIIARAVSRYYILPAIRNNLFGFRVVVVLRPPDEFL